MNGDIKRYIYIIGTICIVFLVGSIFIRILPWLLLVGFIAYIIAKIVGFIKGKSEEKDSSKFDTSKDNESNYSIPSDEYTNGEVIDVEYEDVDNKED